MSQDVNRLCKSLATVRTRTVVGIDAIAVAVEVHLANGLPAFATVGLPETAVREAKDRVRSAILNSGFEFPARRITVNLSPADLPKAGSGFDLPIAIGILLASGQLPKAALSGIEMVGELGLDGSVRAVNGSLPMSIAATAADSSLIVAADNASEAALLQSARILPATSLLEVCAHLLGEHPIEPLSPPAVKTQLQLPDLSDVKGQQQARRALEIAASGGHSMLMVGPPGSGKSMLANRLRGVMPALSEPEALELAAINSVATGKVNPTLWRLRPFRQPHHSASAVALVGGGSVPKPGEISRAHNGILFLDELTEFSRAALEQLREPLERGVIDIARASHSVEFPADFQLIAACNPCRCGYLGDGSDRCQCTGASIERYRAKLSGPILDRIDMHLRLQRVPATLLHAEDELSESSADVQPRVAQSQLLQRARQGCLNAALNSVELERYCRLDAQTTHFLVRASERFQLSARAHYRVLRLARTIADMQDKKQLGEQHISEALAFRSAF